MSATAAASTLRAQRYDFTNEAAAGAILLLLFVLGGLAMLPVTVELLRLWRDDPLRSFGALLPLISILLIVPAWKRQNWQVRGTAWGLLPITVAVVLARTVGTVLIAYRLPHAEISPVQPGLLCFLYGSGVVLLLGGQQLWRATLFPLCLLLCVNPVPHLFERLDFPLQTISANTARGFARLLGLQPSGEQLQMMFAPRFGMVIVPGCDGVRGSATMVYLALLIGYVRRMRARRTGLLMLAGLATGYLLNLTRLCTLVVYYWIGVHFPHLRGDGELIDYCIGGTLFLLVCLVVGALLFGPLPGATAPLGPGKHILPRRVTWGTNLRSARWIAAVLLLLFAALTEVPSAWGLLTDPSDYVEPLAALAKTPASFGPWRRVGQWQENYYGKPVWLWSSYQRTDGARIDFAEWLSPKRHFAIQSRLMNGSKPLLGQPLRAQSLTGTPVEFSTFTLQDDLVENSAPVPTFFAETVCLPSRCTVQESGFAKTGWLIAINPTALGMERHLPILVRVQSTPGEHETPERQAEARRLIGDFTGYVNLSRITGELGAR